MVLIAIKDEFRRAVIDDKACMFRPCSIDHSCNEFSSSPYSFEEASTEDPGHFMVVFGYAQIKFDMLK